MRNIWKDCKRAAHSKAIHHAHHALYCVYYAITLTRDHGATVVIVGGIVFFHALFAIVNDA